MQRHGCPMAPGPPGPGRRHGLPLRRGPQRHAPRQARAPRLRATAGATMPGAEPSLGAGWTLCMEHTWKKKLNRVDLPICLWIFWVTFPRFTLRFRGSVVRS